MNAEFIMMTLDKPEMRANVLVQLYQYDDKVDIVVIVVDFYGRRDNQYYTVETLSEAFAFLADWTNNCISVGWAVTLKGTDAIPKETR